MTATILPMYGVNANVRFLTDVPEAQHIEAEALAIGCFIRPSNGVLDVVGTLRQCEALAERFAAFMICTIPCSGSGLPFDTAGCSVEKGWSCSFAKGALFDEDQSQHIKIHQV